MASLALKSTKSALRKEIKTRLASLSPSSIEAQSPPRCPCVASIARPTNNPPGIKATQTLLSWPKYEAAQRISVYLSMPTSELSTTQIVHHALGAGKQVFVPYLYAATERDVGRDGYRPKRCMDMVKLHDLRDFEGLERDTWGIPTVGEEGLELRERILFDRVEKDGDVKEEVEGLDLMLLPGVAFQEVGGEAAGGVRRLGHGMGFYDFFLRRLGQRGEEYGLDEPELVGLALKEQLLGAEEELPVGEHDALLDGVILGDGRILGSV